MRAVGIRGDACLVLSVMEFFDFDCDSFCHRFLFYRACAVSLYNREASALGRDLMMLGL